MVTPDTYRSETYENSVLMESTTIIEGPPGTFTYTRSDAGGVVIEKRDAVVEEVAILILKQSRAARVAIEQVVRNITRGSVTSSPGVQDAIMAIRELLLAYATSDDT